MSYYQWIVEDSYDKWKTWGHLVRWRPENMRGNNYYLAIASHTGMSEEDFIEFMEISTLDIV